MENSYYEPIKKALEEKFGKLGKCHLEITADKRISNDLKRFFDDTTLHIINVEGFFPDIIGYVEKSEFIGEENHIIVVEIKHKMKIKDIYQAKQYGEIFNAEYTFLIHVESISEEIKRFLKNRPHILSHSAGYQNVRIAQFDKETGKINYIKELV